MSYFDTIAHDRLMALVEVRISDGRVLDLIRGYLKQDVVSELERWAPVGDAARGCHHPLLANLYLHPLDRLMRSKGYHMVRYADDFVVRKA